MEEVSLWNPWPAKMGRRFFSPEFHQFFLKNMIYTREKLLIQFLTEKNNYQVSINFIADSPFRCIPLEHTVDVDESIARLMDKAKVSAPITPFFVRRNSESIRYFLAQDSLFDMVQPHDLVHYTLYAWHSLIDVITWEYPSIEITEN